MAAAFDRQKLLLKKNIKIAFEMFDIDKNGQISKEEFQQILGKVNPSTEELHTLKEQWLTVLAEADTDGNGELSYKEFETAMEKTLAKPTF